MVKAPLPGLAKTRLCPPLAQSEAASLALCFVQDVVQSALGVTQNVIVAFTPLEGRAMLQAYRHVLQTPGRLFGRSQNEEGRSTASDSH